jgi:WD40 repeat protein
MLWGRSCFTLASTTHTVAKTLGDLDLLEYEGTQRFSKLCILTHLSSTSSSVFLLKSRILWHVELACHFCMNWGFRRMTAIAEGEKYAGVIPWPREPVPARGTLEGHSNWVRSVVFSPEGKLVASGPDDVTRQAGTPSRRNEMK